MVALILLFLAFNMGAGFVDLGIVSPSFTDFSVYFAVTLVVCALVYFMSKKKIRRLDRNKILLYAFLRVPAQEFIFRSFLYYFLNKVGLLVFSNFVMISSLFYAFLLHSVFREKMLLWGTLVLGIVWSAIYYLIPNLILVSISHAVVGLWAVSLGVVRGYTFRKT